MSLFSCKTCKAHEAHIKTLEAQLAYFRELNSPAPNASFADLEPIETPPSIQPVYVPDSELKQREFTVDELLTDNYQ